MHYVSQGGSCSHGHGKRNKLIPIVLLVIFAGWLFFTFMNSASDDFKVGKVDQITSEGYSEETELELYTQDVEISFRDESKSLAYEAFGSNVDNIKLKEGQKVVVDERVNSLITDKFRLMSLALAVLIFIAVAVAFGGIEAVYSLVGLAFSTLVLIQVILKGLLSGWPALPVTVLGATLIAVFSIYLAHGIKKRTTIAVVAIVITMLISVLLTVFLVDIAHLFGLGSEDAFYLVTDPNNIINLRGILMAGIIIGTLGVLDDITTSQAAAIDEISKANPSLDSKELYKRGVSVGKEHISSLINTLFLAYAGASLPLLIVFVQSDIPAWVLVNNELIAEEIIRTVVGSTALVLAVPITTLLASKYLRASSK
jgi:uncharacterized membrane protein